MSFNLEDLRGPVTSILTTPGVDLSTISAKRVRKELLADTTLGLTAREMKERRTEVDFLISKIYESISRQGQGDESKRKREEEIDEDGLEHEDQEDVTEERDTGEEPAEDDEKPPPPKKNKSAKQNVDADAELARKISSELNSRSRRGASNGASATPKKRKTKKSAKMVDSGDEDDDEEKPKKKRSGGARGGFAKEYMLRCFKLPPPCFTSFVLCYILMFSPFAANPCQWLLAWTSSRGPKS
jgi:upstream activation factor subunit UAF30